MYEITMRIQDANSADYECPFEAKFVDEDVARAAFNAILDRREFWEELICKRYGLTEEDEPWIQLFLTDDESDYSDEDEYWMSYEVL
jgi:hypothetical protein